MESANETGAEDRSLREFELWGFRLRHRGSTRLFRLLHRLFTGHHLDVQR